MLQVAINGYGTIGKRVADAVRAQPDMAVAGVAKTRPNFEAFGAVERGYPLYTAGGGTPASFREAGLPVAGELPALLDRADVVVDATPSGVGERNLPLYEDHDTPAVLQGGEDADVAEVSFNARANYDAAVDADSVRVVSCNTTGLSRLIAPLSEEYGVEKVRTTLVRRGGDPAQNGRGPINDIVPDPVTVPSHHGPDVQTVFPDLAIDTLGMTVPATLMHVHSVNVTLEAEPTAADVRDLLAAESRTFVVPPVAGIDGPAKLKEHARDVGRPRGDIWENCIWGESVAVRGRDLYCFQAIHQEADVVPENVDAVRAVAGRDNAAESVALTDEQLGIGLDLGVGTRPGRTRRAVAGRGDD